MKILILEPFFSGSHQRWALEFQVQSRHDIQIMSLPGKHWKWRMHGAAVYFARELDLLPEMPDLILATDMLDLTTFLALTRQKIASIPIALYFHENQITYPWSPTDADISLQRNNQYGFINYTSALAADRVFFNSEYHKNSFLGALPDFLRQFPDRRCMDTVTQIAEKSEVLYLGMDLHKFATIASPSKKETPILLWNHRWEYDKNPVEFFTALFQLQAENIDFRLIVTGENYSSAPSIFAEARKQLVTKIIHFGYVDSFKEYAELLHLADILPVTSRQDFFGGSVVEAIYCNCFPLLPHRLAYREHIPAGQEVQHLYEEGKFYERIKNALLNFERKEYRHFVEQYDWTNLIVKYDEKLRVLKA